MEPCLIGDYTALSELFYFLVHRCLEFFKGLFVFVAFAFRHLEHIEPYSLAERTALSHCYKVSNRYIPRKATHHSLAVSIEFQSDDVTKMILLKLWNFFTCSEQPT